MDSETFRISLLALIDMEESMNISFAFLAHGAK